MSERPLNPAPAPLLDSEPRGIRERQRHRQRNHRQADRQPQRAGEQRGTRRDERQRRRDNQTDGQDRRQQQPAERAGQRRTERYRADGGERDFFCGTAVNHCGDRRGVHEHARYGAGVGVRGAQRHQRAAAVAVRCRRACRGRRRDEAAGRQPPVFFRQRRADQHEPVGERRAQRFGRPGATQHVDQRIGRQGLKVPGRHQVDGFRHRHAGVAQHGANQRRHAVALDSGKRARYAAVHPAGVARQFKEGDGIVGHFEQDRQHRAAPRCAPEHDALAMAAQRGAEAGIVVAREPAGVIGEQDIEADHAGVRTECRVEGARKRVAEEHPRNVAQFRRIERAFVERDDGDRRGPRQWIETVCMMGRQAGVVD